MSAMSATPRTWENNADDFASLDRGEAWPFARLVACSVERGAGNGRPRTSAITEVSNGKVSMKAFAARAGTDDKRVARYLAAWDRAAEAGHVTPAAELTPADVTTAAIRNGVKFADFYDASDAGGRPRDSKVEDAVNIIEKRGVAAVVEAMTPELREEVTAELLRRPEPQLEDLAEHHEGLSRLPDERPELADESIADAAADERMEAARSSRTTMRRFEVEKLLLRAKSSILAASTVADKVTFTEDDREVLQSTAQEVTDALTSFAHAVESYDWDAEARTLGEAS
jgi:hypothetical protein